jgi:hypothetical protein
MKINGSLSDTVINLQLLLPSAWRLKHSRKKGVLLSSQNFFSFELTKVVAFPTACPYTAVLVVFGTSLTRGRALAVS